MIPPSELNSNPDNTALSAEDAEQLIPDLSTRQDLDEYERQNILLAQDWAFSTRALKHNDPLDEIYIRELHRQMFKDTWKWAGKYRIRDVNRGCSSAEIITRTMIVRMLNRKWCTCTVSPPMAFDEEFGLSITRSGFSHRRAGGRHRCLSPEAESRQGRGRPH